MIIKKIKKASSNKYKIYLEDEVINTYDSVILENDLLYKKNIDKILYDKIIFETNFYDVYYKTVKYIEKKRRSEKEIISYLNKFKISEADINKIISKLKGLNLINDIEYTRAYINDKIYLSKEGINKVRKDLIKENISLDIINSELDRVDTSIIDDKLEKLIIKKLNSNKKYSKDYMRQKILYEMTNLGYDKNTILNIIDNNISSDDNILESELNKIYNRLKNKYSGIELENKVRNNLLRKGFLIEDINILLNKK